MKKNTQKEKSEKELLEDIKDLLILANAKLGASNTDIAKVLNCGESTLRKKVSFSKTKK